MTSEKNYAVIDGGIEDGEQISVLSVRLPTLTLVGAMNASDALKMPFHQFVAEALNDHNTRRIAELDPESSD